MNSGSEDPIVFGGGLPDPVMYPSLAPLLAEAWAQTDSLAYGGNWGDEGLRHALAARLSGRAGLALPADQVLLTNGSAGAIGLVAALLVHPGEVVAVEERTYPGALTIFGQYGGRVFPIRMDRDGLDVDHLRQAFRSGRPADRPRLIYTIATCQSPSGTILSDERRRELVTLASHYGCVLVQDDTYGEIVYTNPPPLPLLGLLPAQTLHLGSFSKTMAPGLRMGWIAGPGSLCQQLAAVRTDLGASPLLQRAVGRFCEGGRFEPHLRKLTAFYLDKRDVLMDALQAHCSPYGTWNTPDGGFFSWFELHDTDLDQLEKMAVDEGVGFLADPYFSAGPASRSGLRLAYGQLPTAHLQEGVRRLGRALQRAHALSATRSL